MRPLTFHDPTGPRVSFRTQLVEMELIEACRNGRLEVVRRVLADERVDPAACDNYAIRRASEYGHVEVVRLLLSDERADPAAWDNYAIQWASGNGHVKVVRLLLADERVDPSDYCNAAIQWASENGHVEVVQLLLSGGRVNPAAWNNEAIRRASENGHVEVVRLLLADGRANPRATKRVFVAYKVWLERVRVLAASLRGLLLSRTGLSEDLVAEVLFWAVPVRQAKVVLSHSEGMGVK